MGGVPSSINESLVLGGTGGGGDILEPPILSGIDLSTSIGREPTYRIMKVITHRPI